ncbi:ribonuclease P protein component [Hyphomicrobium sp.]|uniref:ribonuclease P protein component n=1 Tax=Hyphomicrobium sp. TaxID=82 RepID=UPI003F7006FC
MAVATLKKRSEFLRLRGGARFATPSFVVETRPRGPDTGGPTANGATQPPPGAANAPRFGFTVTKKLGGAVVRNRIRRRLKAVVGLVAPDLARADHDYVLVARLAALDRAFADLKKDLERALQRVHHPAAVTKRERSP